MATDTPDTGHARKRRAKKDDAAPARRWEWDWTLAHGPLAGTINAAGAAMTSAMVADLAGMEPWWAAGAGVAGAGAAALAGAHSGLSRAGLAYRAACWAAAGGWTTYALETSPWSLDSLGSLLVGGVAGGLLAPVFARHERAEDARRRRMILATSRARIVEEWIDRIERVCRIRGVKIPTLVDWESGAGYSMDVDLPRGGASWRTLASFADALANDANLPSGAGVEIRQGTSRRSVVMEVSTVDGFAAELPFPDDYSPQTINNPIMIGGHRNTTPTVAELRETYAVVVGDQGTGKTNTIGVLQGQLARCVDVITCHIDPNGGGLSRPWVMPWVEGKCARPGVDWVAYEPVEARRMTAALLRAMTRRKAAYFDRMRQANDDKLPVGPDVPAIELIVDEAAEIMGADAPRAWWPVRDNLRAIQRQGRAMGILIIFTGLRATAEIFGSATVKRLTQLRVGMGVRDQAERALLFGQAATLDPHEEMGRGYGHVAYRGEAPRAFKALRLRPAQIEQICIAVADRRPDPDAVTLAELGEDWTGRWDRTLPGLIAADPDGDGLASPEDLVAFAAGLAAQAAGEDPNAAMAQARDAGPDAARDLLNDVLGDGPDDASTANARAADAVERARRLLAEQRAWQEITNGWQETAADPRTPATGDGEGQAAPDEQIDTETARARMLELLYAAGPAGMTATAIWEALDQESIRRTRQAISDWLRLAVAAGQVVQPRERGPYIHADHAPTPPAADDGQ